MKENADTAGTFCESCPHLGRLNSKNTIHLAERVSPDVDALTLKTQMVVLYALKCDEGRISNSETVFMPAITLSKKIVDLPVSNEPLGFFLVSTLVFAITVDVVEGWRVGRGEGGPQQRQHRGT